MGKPRIHREETYNETRIYQSPSGSRAEILAAIHQIFDYMWSVSHGRLYVCHFTVNFPSTFTLQANDFLTGTLQSWRRTMQNRRVPAEYLWGREKGDFELLALQAFEERCQAGQVQSSITRQFLLGQEGFRQARQSRRRDRVGLLHRQGRHQGGSFRPEDLRLFQRLSSAASDFSLDFGGRGRFRRR